MPEPSPVAERVRRLLAEVLHLPPDAVTDDLDMESSASWTSLRHLMLVSQLEARFGVLLTNEEIAALTSYRRIVDRLAGGAAPG